jgi:hypothetical protein
VPLDLSKDAHDIDASISNLVNCFNANSVRRVVERRRSVKEEKQITTAKAKKIKKIPLKYHTRQKSD